MLSWTRYHGDAHHVDQQTPRPWYQVFPSSHAPGPSLLPLSACRSYRVLMDGHAEGKYITLTITSKFVNHLIYII